MKPASSLRADLTIAGIALIWGTTFVVVKAALADVSTLLFLALRFSFASALLFVAFRPRVAASSLTRRSFAGGALCGLLLFLGYAFQTAGLRITSASRSAFITGVYIILVPLLAAALARGHPRAGEWGGAASALAGTWLLTSGTLSGSFNLGDGLTLACAVVFAAHIVAVAHFSPRMNLEWLTLLQVCGVAVLSLLTFPWLEVPHVRWSQRLIVALLVTGALATALSFSLYTWAQRHTTATRAALLFALEPVFAGLTAWLFAGERWTSHSLAGAALILVGILLVEVRPVRGTS
jgi:drug/metabolite transporter (DMT)-like permease